MSKGKKSSQESTIGENKIESMGEKLRTWETAPEMTISSKQSLQKDRIGNEARLKLKETIEGKCLKPNKTHPQIRRTLLAYKKC